MSSDRAGKLKHKFASFRIPSNVMTSSSTPSNFPFQTACDYSSGIYVFLESTRCRKIAPLEDLEYVAIPSPLLFYKQLTVNVSKIGALNLAFPLASPRPLPKDAGLRPDREYSHRARVNLNPLPLVLELEEDVLDVL